MVRKRKVTATSKKASSKKKAVSKRKTSVKKKARTRSSTSSSGGTGNAISVLRKAFARNPKTTSAALIAKVKASGIKLGDVYITSKHNEFVKLYEALQEAGKVKG